MIDFSSVNLIGWASDWKFGINDPTLIAWIIVGFYLLTMWYCWRAGRRVPLSERSDVPSESAQSTVWLSITGSTTAALWFLLAVIMLFMGANKQLDLHSPIVPRLQKALFWNDYWSVNAIIFVVVATVVGLVTSIVGLRLLFRQSRRLQVAYLAFASLLALQAVRFSPTRLSDVLVYHLLHEDEGWLHIHTIEVLELLILLVISWLARKTINDCELSNDRVSIEENIQS